MAARAIGSGTISFGLVSIPVKLYSTVDSTKAIRFNYLTEDGERVKQQYVRSTDGEVVERSSLHQGYEFAKGQYVMFTQDEVKAMNVESTNAIDISEFVPLAAIERIYIDKVYYLGPDKGAARSYHLLREALQRTGRAALASYAARGKSHLVLVRSFARTDDGAQDAGLVMEQLKHEDELRPFNEVPLDSADIADDELDLAVKIIEQRINESFEPENYEDVVRGRMMELIQQKIDGQDIAMPAEQQSEAKIVDLMEALQASIGKADRKAETAKSAGAKKKASAPKKSAPKRKAAARAARKPSATKAKSASNKGAGK